MSSNEIFVFGSNLAGRHGRGSALHARLHWGAIYRQGEGLQGSSYAVPTKNNDLRPLPLWKIAEHVNLFIEFAKTRPDLTFYISAIGTGLAGYSHEQMAPMFAGVPANCHLPGEWRLIVEKLRRVD